MTTHIFIRHGILSEADNMVPLVRAIEGTLGAQIPIRIHNAGYVWTDSVLLWGLQLARDVVAQLGQDASASRLVLVGHSQGGLVCRVAAAALCCRDDLERGLTAERYIDETYRTTAKNMLRSIGDSREAAAKLKGIIMLATPNTGAFTFGQLSMTGKLIQRGVRLLTGAAGKVNLSDLTTDRLFRILQHVRLPGVRYLSVSGSKINRFSALSYSDLASVPIVDRLGVKLSLPNDSVVEDESTDLSKAVLRPEIADLAAQYRHVRWYLNCSEVSHTGIHGNLDVQQLVADQIRDWCV